MTSFTSPLIGKKLGNRTVKEAYSMPSCAGIKLEFTNGEWCDVSYNISVKLANGEEFDQEEVDKSIEFWPEYWHQRFPKRTNIED